MFPSGLGTQLIGGVDRTHRAIEFALLNQARNFTSKLGHGNAGTGHWGTGTAIDLGGGFAVGAEQAQNLCGRIFEIGRIAFLAAAKVVGDLAQLFLGHIVFPYLIPYRIERVAEFRVLGVRENDGRVRLGHLVDGLIERRFAEGRILLPHEVLDRLPLEDLMRLKLACQVCRELRRHPVRHDDLLLPYRLGHDVLAVILDHVVGELERVGIEFLDNHRLAEAGFLDDFLNEFLRLHADANHDGHQPDTGLQQRKAEASDILSTGHSVP